MAGLARGRAQPGVHDLAQAAALLGGQEALALVAAEAFDRVGRVAHLRHLPVDQDPRVEAAEHGQDVVGGARRGAQAGVQRLGVAAGDGVKFAGTQRWHNHRIDAMAVVHGGAVLEVHVDVLAEEALGELADRGARPFWFHRPRG